MQRPETKDWIQFATVMSILIGVLGGGIIGVLYVIQEIPSAAPVILISAFLVWGLAGSIAGGSILILALVVVTYIGKKLVKVIFR